MRTIISTLLLLISLTGIAGQRIYYTDTRQIALPDTASEIAIEAHAAFVKNNLRDKWWGISWNRTAPDCYFFATLQCGSTGLDPLLDSRYMDITIGQCIGSRKKILAASRLTDGVDLYNGYNAIAIEWKSDTVTVSVGSGNLIPIAKINSPCPGDSAAIIGSGDLDVRLLVVEHAPIPAPISSQSMTIAQLDSHFASSTDPYEGYWVYLDRATDDRRARLGGDYRIAIIHNGYDYLIYYISGATVNPDAWQSGMLKARLSATAFINQFDATWYDSLLSPIDREVHARFDNSATLTIEFPLLNSQIRFSKAFAK